MYHRLKTITLTATITTAFLLVAVVGLAALAPRWQSRAGQATEKRQLWFLLTPKAISDFTHPAASVRAIYDVIAPTLDARDQPNFIFAVGSHDHILRYGPPAPSQPLAIKFSEAPTYPATTQLNNGILASLALEPRGPFTVKLPLITPLEITPTTALTWDWRGSNVQDLVIRFTLRNTVTNETDTLSYRAAGAEQRPGFDATEDFLIDPPTKISATPAIALAQDLFRKRTTDQNTHLVEQESWNMVALTLEGAVDTITFADPRVVDAGVNWARAVYGDDQNQSPPLAQRNRRYPQLLSYANIQTIVDEIKLEGQRRGLAVRVLDALESSTEFSRQDWLYGLHPEALFIPERPALPTLDLATKLKADKNSYASFPNGLPAGITSGQLLIKQTARYLADLHFDGVYFMNAFGTIGAWYPQRAKSADESFLKFFQGLRAALPNKYILWMDSYYPRWVETQHYGIPDDFYDLIDGLEISTFWQDSEGKPIIRWNPEGMFGTMADTISTKLALKQDHPKLDILATFYARDPWYTFGYEDTIALDWFTRDRTQFNGAVIYSINDAFGTIKQFPQSILDQLK